jgi:antirestriction protein ArdC
MTNTATARPDVYSRITDKIITDLEQGVRPWLGSRHRTGRIARLEARTGNIAWISCLWRRSGSV